MVFSLRNPLRTAVQSSSAVVDRIVVQQPVLARLSDAEVRSKSLELRFQAKSGQPLQQLLPDAFALVREAATRTIGLSHFNVQLLGGIAIHDGSIAEMESGEGKTLFATLPMYLFALQGRGSHLATANDYLAARDADIMRPV